MIDRHVADHPFISSLRSVLDLGRARSQSHKGIDKIIANIKWLLFDKILRLGLGLLIGILVARYLGAEQFGIWNFAIAFVAIFSAIANLGLETVVTRDLIKEPSKMPELLGNAFILRLFGAFVLCLLVSITIHFYRPGDMLSFWLVLISAIGTAFQAFDVIDFYFQSQLLSKFTVYAKNSAFIVFSLIKLGMIFLKLPLIAFALAGLCEIMFGSLLMVAFFQVNDQNLLRWRFKLDSALSLLRITWPLILTDISIMIYMRIDQVMLANMVNNTELGIYSAAVKISEIWYFIPMAIVASVFPSIISAKQTNEAIYQKRIQGLYSLMTWMGIAIALPMTFLSDFIMNLLYGREFIGSGPVLTISIWAGIFVAQGVARGKWLLAEDLQAYSFWYAGMAAIFNIVLNYYLIPIYGGKGAAFATLISYAASVIVFPLFFKKTRQSSLLLIKSFHIGKAFQGIASWE